MIIALALLTSPARAGFEGSDTRALILPLGKLEYPLEADIPPQ